ncbi:hypothetical protein [Spiroplasma helicoides]|uniref:hypothetical protein n=1 Tax=Spiroplasma helicoides TaxID=216938 RepID=UPI00083FD0FA|nr:hypothetical protein [Spiroplasma helicoides]
MKKVFGILLSISVVVFASSYAISCDSFLLNDVPNQPSSQQEAQTQYKTESDLLSTYKQKNSVKEYLENISVANDQKENTELEKKMRLDKDVQNYIKQDYLVSSWSFKVEVFSSYQGKQPDNPTSSTYKSLLETYNMVNKEEDESDFSSSSKFKLNCMYESSKSYIKKLFINFVQEKPQ